MGSGIAQAAAAAGFPRSSGTWLTELLEKGRRSIEKSLAGWWRKGSSTLGARGATRTPRFTTDLCRPRRLGTS